MANHCQHIDETTQEQCKAYEAKGTGYCAGHARARGLLPPTVRKPKAEKIDKAIGEGYGIVRDEMISVGEPEALVALRQLTHELEVGGKIDSAAAVQLANILRPYFGLSELEPARLATHIDQRIAVDEQIASSENARLRLLQKSYELIREDVRPDEQAAIDAKVQRDIERASMSYHDQMTRTRDSLVREPKVQVAGTGEDETYVVNGVRVVIPATGIFEVPASIARMHQERMRGMQEARMRSELMMRTPEFTEVQRGMAAIDARFNSGSLLGGGVYDQEASDYLAIEEIKHG